MSTFVRAFAYPVLEEGNLSFPNGNYKPVLSKGNQNNTVIVEHKLHGAPLIERLIKSNKASFACSISIPITGYRRIHLVQDNAPFQELGWNPAEQGEPPYFRPHIVYTANKYTYTLNKKDGVSEEWWGTKAPIEKGAKLAFAPFYQQYSVLGSLLSINLDRDRPDGTFEIQPNSNKGFYFKILVAQDLLRFLKRTGEGIYKQHRNSIYTHIVSCCFERLRKDFGSDNVVDDGWKSFPNLVNLAQLLQESGEKIWDDPDFVPEEVALSLHPHKVIFAEIGVNGDGNNNV